MRHVKELIQSLALGDHLTDSEMVFLRDAYKAVRIAAAPMGEAYWPVVKDAASNEQKLDGFLRSRGVQA
jgi:hypothetical protein